MRPLFSSRNRDAARLAVTLARIAASELPVLLEGETGTGKSRTARAIHRRSRPARPFVVVDCGALPETLVASELFGHRAGAFTDATRAREGFLARAAGGTLLLDRVDALPGSAQAALLRVLEERTFFPVGATTARRFSARVLATVADGVDGLLAGGSFRDDLYHRLAGFHAVLPPLRRRQEDIVPFARATLRALSRRGGEGRTLDDDAEALIRAYPWPGNFRELETALARACLRSPHPSLGAADLGLPPGGWPAVAALAAERQLPAHEVTRLYGLYVLGQHGGNVSRAARVLGISRRTLIRWRRAG